MVGGIVAQPMQPVSDQEEWLLLDELAQVSALSDGVKACHYTQCHNALRLPNKEWQWSQAPTIAQLLSVRQKSGTKFLYCVQMPG
ncbi:hypothetical protein BOO91_02590 [Vibrio navarrensis]|nr:hypothetical protein UF06_16255 [Vibrio sp. S234-5]MBE3659837.1 hypothetical protein [Vibrio navarrensis]MBE4603943.1 hypothetical protein [Vibrio navarrensis]